MSQNAQESRLQTSQVVKGWDGHDDDHEHDDDDDYDGGDGGDGDDGGDKYANLWCHCAWYKSIHFQE